MRGLHLIGLALWAASNAMAQPAVDLTVMAAWKGWSRPERATEVDIRVVTAASTSASVTVVAGNQTVHATIDAAEAGRGQRMHVPIGPAESVAVMVDSATGPPARREVRIAQSESPLLGVALAHDARLAIEGFHSVSLDAVDFPRNASAYASIDALVLDAPTLAALDQKQLTALITYLAQCGRAAIVDGDGRLGHAFDDAAGCGGRFLVGGATPLDAVKALQSSLHVARPSAITLGALGGLGRPDDSSWNRVVVLVAAGLCALCVVTAFSSSALAFVLAAGLAACVTALALYAMPPLETTLLWSEATGGSRVAGYAAWQRLSGFARAEARVGAIAELGAVRSCESAMPARFDFDVARDSLSSIAFDTRLFQQVALCYVGILPVPQAIATGAQPGEVVSARGDKSTTSAAGQAALSRIPMDGKAALWTLEVPGVANRSMDAKAWLLLRLAP